VKTKIKEYRERLGITQEALAAKTDVPRQTILVLEKGKYTPSLRLAWKIAQILKADKIEDLFSFEDENLPNGEFAASS
jgi:putative transcriptional regulator